MTHRTRALRAFAMVAATATFALPQPAFAEPLFPRAYVWIDSWLASWVTVCAEGDVNDGATAVARWVFTVAGAVPTDPVPIGPYVQIAATDSFFDCHTVYAGSPPDAAFAATLSFAGAVTDVNAVATTDLVGVAGLAYEWNSVLGHGNTMSFGSPG